MVLSFYLAQRFLFMLSYQMRSVAIGWQVYDLTRSPMDLGLVGLMQFLPAAGFALVAGQLVDRYDRKKIIFGCQVVDLCCSTAFFFLAQRSDIDVKIIYALLFVLGCTRPFMGSGGQAYLPSIVSKELFPRAVASSSTVWQTAAIAGPALGGMLYGFSGTPDTVYATCMISGLLALGFVSRLPSPKVELHKGPITFDSFFAGVKFIWARKSILGAISLDLFAVLLGGAVALLPIYARDILHTGPTGLGFLRAAPGAGAAVTAIVLAFYPIKRNAGPLMFFCVLLFGIFTIIFGISTNYALSLFCLTAMGAADVISVVIRGTLVQIKTPSEMRGRVSAVDLLFVGASNELGEFESGVTAAWFGTVPAVVMGGVGTCAVVFIWRKLFPELYHMNELS